MSLTDIFGVNRPYIPAPGAKKPDPPPVPDATFEFEAGLAINPANGNALIRAGVTGDAWIQTGFSFERVFITGGGMFLRAGWTGYATQETAEKLRILIQSSLGMAVAIGETNWEIYKTVGADGVTPIPQRQLDITIGEGDSKRMVRLNAGLVASNMVRTSMPYALQMIADELR